jgi:tRNA nucleotidyltransferase (CCA-adding enzyme)
VILGFDIECSIKKEMIENAYLLNNIPKHRYIKELDYILLSDNPSNYIREYKEIFFEIFKPLKDTYDFNQHSKWHHLDVFDHIMSVVDTVKQDLVLRLAALYHDIKKPECFTIDERGGHFYNHFDLSAQYARLSMNEFRYSNDIIDRVYNIVFYHDRPLENTDKSVLRFIYKFGLSDLDLYFGIKRADILSQNPELIDRIYEIDKIATRCKDIIDNKKYINTSTLNIKGIDLINLGFEPRCIKDILNKLIQLVISNVIKNEHDELLYHAMKYIDKD